MKTKIVTAMLLVLFVIISVSFAIATPHMIPTIILAWIMLMLQFKFECFN